MSADSKPNILPSIAVKTEVVAAHTSGLERCRVLNSDHRSVTLPSAPNNQSRRRAQQASKAALASPVRADPCGLARLIQAASLQREFFSLNSCKMISARHLFAMSGNEEIVKRSVRIAGHATSISLEPAFWQALSEIAARRDLSLNALLSQIAAERGVVGVAVRLVEADKNDRRRNFVLGEVCREFGHGNPRRPVPGKTIDPGRDGGDGNRLKPLLAGDCQAGAVAAGQDVRFACIAAAPYRTDRMNDMPGRQPIAAGQPCLSRRAATDPAAFGEEFRAGGAVNRAIDPAAAKQRRIGGIDDRIDRQPGDIAEFNADAVGESTRHRHLLPSRAQQALAWPFSRR